MAALAWIWSLLARWGSRGLLADELAPPTRGRIVPPQRPPARSSYPYVAEAREGPNRHDRRALIHNGFDRAGRRHARAELGQAARQNSAQIREVVKKIRASAKPMSTALADYDFAPAT